MQFLIATRTTNGEDGAQTSLSNTPLRAFAVYKCHNGSGRPVPNFIRFHFSATNETSAFTFPYMRSLKISHDLIPRRRKTIPRSNRNEFTRNRILSNATDHSPPCRVCNLRCPVSEQNLGFCPPLSHANVTHDLYEPAVRGSGFDTASATRPVSIH